MGKATPKIQHQYEGIAWKKESFLDGHIFVHSISPHRVSDEVSSALTQKNFKLVDVKKEATIYLQGKNVIEATEVTEVHVEKLRVTEASIISQTNPSGKTNTIVINEGEPSVFTADTPIDLKLLPGPEAGEEEKGPSPETQSSQKLAAADVRKVENERLVFRQEISRRKNSYFFRAKDGAALFKLGNSYYEAYKEGIRSFSFSHLAGGDAQKRSILGIASFIHYHENLRILIVSPTLRDSYFSDFRTPVNVDRISLSTNKDLSFEVYRHEGLTYLEVAELQARAEEYQIKDQVYLLKSLMADYDIVLFDLPEIKQMKQLYDIYFPVLQIVQNVSFVVGLKKSTFREIESLKHFFENYKISIKGVIVSNN